MPFVTPLGADDPRRVGRYRLSGRIADDPADPGPTNSYAARLPDGAMASVALLGKDWAPGGASRDRFTAEAKAARKVAPFCAARVLDAGFEGDEPYLVSEFVEGPSLTEAVEAEGAFGEPDLNALALGTATGLTAVHQAGLVHGDFGPDHVVLGADGPRVVHFSITPPYGSATPSADMLAWAQTVLFAAAGRPAIGPQDLNFLPEPLRGTVAACLTPDPGGRPPARSVVTALLGRSDPAAGLLAEGTRRSRAAARGGPRGGAAKATQEFPAVSRSTARRVGWVSACAACVIAIAGASTLIFMHHGGSAKDGLRPSSDNRAASSAKATSPTPTVTPTIPATLAGSWSGLVHQTDPALQVTVKITFTAGSPTGTISYTELKCTGHLELVSAADGKLTLDEGISTGQQSCTGGVVTLTQQANGTLTFSFSRSNGPSPTGVLTKQA
jgi:eukaryotic-like serine/threonine-protein kinase